MRKQKESQTGDFNSDFSDEIVEKDKDFFKIETFPINKAPNRSV